MPGIVLHQFKAVYWPIPKNACSTIKQQYVELLGFDQTTFLKVHDAPFEYTQNSINGYENFAFVRNPYARLYALWFDKVKDETEFDCNVFGGLDDVVWLGMPFFEFASTILLQKTRFDPHWMPQHTQMPNECRIFKLELCCLPFLFPKKNQHSISDWHLAYDESLYQLVGNYYQKDFDMFGYDRR